MKAVCLGAGSGPGTVRVELARKERFPRPGPRGPGSNSLIRVRGHEVKENRVGEGPRPLGPTPSPCGFKAGPDPGRARDTSRTSSGSHVKSKETDHG